MTQNEIIKIYNSSVLTGNELSRFGTAMFLAPILKKTGFRFSKAYRHEASKFHAFIYRHVNTVAANQLANAS